MKVKDCNGVVHREYLPQGPMVNKEYYLEVMHRLSEVIRQKRTELRKNQSLILHQDNAPGQTSMLVHEFLAKNKSRLNHRITRTRPQLTVPSFQI